MRGVGGLNLNPYRRGHCRAGAVGRPFHHNQQIQPAPLTAMSINQGNRVPRAGQQHNKRIHRPASPVGCSDIAATADMAANGIHNVYPAQ